MGDLFQRIEARVPQFDIRTLAISRHDHPPSPPNEPDRTGFSDHSGDCSGNVPSAADGRICRARRHSRLVDLGLLLGCLGSRDNRVLPGGANGVWDHDIDMPSCPGSAIQPRPASKIPATLVDFCHYFRNWLRPRWMVMSRAAEELSCLVTEILNLPPNRDSTELHRPPLHSSRTAGEADYRSTLASAPHFLREKAEEQRHADTGYGGIIARSFVS